MSNYEDWDPEWRPVGDPVPTEDDSSEYDWNEEGSTGEYVPSEPSLPVMDTADLEASEPTLGEAWAELRRQYEQAGLGVGGVEPESPDQVVWGWRARLEEPDKYGPAELGPEDVGAAHAYAYPDVEEELGAGAYTAPQSYQDAVPLPSADWEGPKLPPFATPTGEPWKPLTTEPSQPKQPEWLQGIADTVLYPFVKAGRADAAIKQDILDKARSGDIAGLAQSLATTPLRELTDVTLPLYGDYLKALGEPAKWVERDIEGSYLDVANDVAKNPGVYQPITDPNRDYSLQPWSPTSKELPPGRDKIIQALAALPDQERQEAIYQLKNIAYTPQENQLKALEESKTKGWQKAIEDSADPWAEMVWQGVLDPLWVVPAKWGDKLFKPANLPLEVLGGAAKAGARGLAERIPWAKGVEFGREAWQSGSRAAAMFSDELKPRLVGLRERVAQAIEREIGLPEAVRREVAGKLRGFQIRTPGELLNTLLEGPKGQPKIWDYLPSRAIPDEGVPLLREVSGQLKGLSNPTRETVTEVFDQARARARQLVDQAKEAVARVAQREESQPTRKAATASAGKEPNLWETVNQKREEVQRGLSAAKEEFQRRMDALYPPNRELAPEGLTRGWNAGQETRITAASAGKGSAGKKVEGPKMPSKGEQPTGPKMPSKSESPIGPEMPKREPPAGPAGQGGGRVPGGTGGEPPGKPPMAGIPAPKGNEGDELLLKVLNERRAPGTAPFQSFDDVSKRVDEAKRIVDQYRATTPGFVSADAKPGTKPGRINRRALMKQPLTDVDTPVVLDARLLNALTPSTASINTPERVQLRFDNIKHLYDYAAEHYGIVPKRERIAYIITGNAGGGKSTLAKPVAQGAHARIIDIDDARQFYPEYNGINSSAVHEEAVWTFDRTLEMATQNGDNIVIPRVGGKPESVRKLRDALVEMGYEVHLATMDVSVETAKKSVVARFEGSERRFVDPVMVERIGLTPVETYEILKKEGGFASYERFTREGIPDG